MLELCVEIPWDFRTYQASTLNWVPLAAIHLLFIYFFFFLSIYLLINVIFIFIFTFIKFIVIIVLIIITIVIIIYLLFFSSLFFIYDAYHENPL